MAASKAVSRPWVIRTLPQLRSGPLPKRLAIHIPGKPWMKFAKGVKDSRKKQPGFGLQVVELPGKDEGVLLLPTCMSGQGGDCCGGEGEPHTGDCTPIPIRTKKGTITFRCQHTNMRSGPRIIRIPCPIDMDPKSPPSKPIPIGCHPEECRGYCEKMFIFRRGTDHTITRTLVCLCSRIIDRRKPPTST